MGELLHFRKDGDATGATGSGRPLESVTCLLSTLADEQIRAADELEDLLTRLEGAEKSLLKTGAATLRSQNLLMGQAEKIESLIGRAREKLRELRLLSSIS
ncbi:hypothetical protein [Bradyrhizobium sp.]|jgi:hypothetical protein|uniref:hypothetical protein n=1 Tax=Bradyrhizobium sp. TaxID=376 RepID=UPI003C20962A